MFDNGTAMSIWASSNTTQTQIKGIPNFFSKSMFGNTEDLISAAQTTVVWAVVAVIMRIFSRRRMKTRIWWDDVCTIGGVFFLVTNQTLFSLVDYLGKFGYNRFVGVYTYITNFLTSGRSTFAFMGRADQEEERKRIANIIVGLKLSLAFEVMYLMSIFLVKFGMLFLYARFA